MVFVYDITDRDSFTNLGKHNNIPFNLHKGEGRFSRLRRRKKGRKGVDGVISLIFNRIPVVYWL